MNYLDTSALVKRFVAEPGSDLVQRLVGTEGPVATATIAYAEVSSGLTRRRREGGLSTKDYDFACVSFEGDWKAVVRVELKAEVLSLARDLIRRHPLRGFDAIHLASALRLQSDLGLALTFAAAGAKLLRAAAAERLAVIDVEAAPAQ